MGTPDSAQGESRETQVGRRAPVWALLFRRKGRLLTTGAWRVNTCLGNKWISLVSHSHSVFYPHYDLEQFASLLRSSWDPWRKKCKVSCGHMTPEGTEDIPGNMATQARLRSLFDPSLFACYFMAASFHFLSIFLIHQGQTGQTLGLYCLYPPFDRLETEFFSLWRNSLRSGIQSRFIRSESVLFSFTV